MPTESTQEMLARVVRMAVDSPVRDALRWLLAERERLEHEVEQLRERAAIADKPQQPEKLFAHWLSVALGRVNAGEPEREVMADYGWVPIQPAAAAEVPDGKTPGQVAQEAHASIWKASGALPEYPSGRDGPVGVAAWEAAAQAVISNLNLRWDEATLKLAQDVGYWQARAYELEAAAQAVRSMPWEPRWFQGHPTDNGWYFYAKRSEDWDSCIPTLVHQIESGVFVARIAGLWQRVTKLPATAIWYGPIKSGRPPQPEPPSEQPAKGGAT